MKFPRHKLGGRTEDKFPDGEPEESGSPRAACSARLPDDGFIAAYRESRMIEHVKASWLPLAAFFQKGIIADDKLLVD